jgi:hypothetical protein
MLCGKNVLKILMYATCGYNCLNLGWASRLTNPYLANKGYFLKSIIFSFANLSDS